MTIALKTLIRQFSTVACSRRIGGFTSSQRTIGVLLINCSRSGMFYCGCGMFHCTQWYVACLVKSPIKARQACVENYNATFPTLQWFHIFEHFEHVVTTKHNSRAE